MTLSYHSLDTIAQAQGGVQGHHVIMEETNTFTSNTAFQLLPSLIQFDPNLPIDCLGN